MPGPRARGCDDAPDDIRRDCRSDTASRAGDGFGHRVESSRSTSSRTAAAISRFGAFATWRSSVSERTTTSFSGPRRSRCPHAATSLKTKRSALGAALLARPPRARRRRRRRRSRRGPGRTGVAPSAASTSDGRLELDGPAAPVLRTLSRPSETEDGSRRPRRGHDDDVRIRPCERLPLEIGGGRRLDDRRRPPARRTARFAASSVTSRPAPRLLGERRLPCARTERFRGKRTVSSGSACLLPRDDHGGQRGNRRRSAPAEQTRRSGRRSRPARPSAPRPPRPRQAHPSAARMISTPRSRSSPRWPAVAGCSHMRTFIAGRRERGRSARAPPR